MKKVIQDNHDLNFYFNPKNIPNQDLVFDTYNFFKKGAGRGLFDPLEFLNILNWHYNFLVANLEMPFHVIQNLNDQNLQSTQLIALKAFLLKWFGGYPVNNLNPQFNTILRLIEEEYEEFFKEIDKSADETEDSLDFYRELDKMAASAWPLQNPNETLIDSAHEILQPKTEIHENTFLFISHSSKDSELVKAFCDKVLVLALRIKPEQIFCTAIEGYSIKTGEDFRKGIQ